MATENDKTDISGQVSDPTQPNQNGGGAPLVFFQEKSIFGERRPQQSEWIKHSEMYEDISKRIDPTHITGLQRVRGMWRIYLDNLRDKVCLISKGLPLRGRVLDILSTNPGRPDGENTIQIKVMDIPLSADDGTIKRVLILRGLEVISLTRDKLRFNGKLTNCETGDRIIIIKATTLSEPLPKFMDFGQFKGRVWHRGQMSPKNDKCSKCLQQGHHVSKCPNEWMCTQCLTSGHKRSDCPGVESPSESDTLDSSDDSDAETTEPIPTPTPAISKHKPKEDTAPITPKAKPKTRKAKKNKHQLSGQQAIDQFVSSVKNNTNTPNRGKQQSVSRSPRSPAETIYQQSVKKFCDEHKKS